MESGPDLEAVLGLVADDYARVLLAAVDRRPRSAQALSDEYDMSLSTVYRRLDALERHGLVTERTVYQSDGDHYSMYDAQLERLELRLKDGEFHLSLDAGGDAVDRMVDIFQKMRDP